MLVVESFWPLGPGPERPLLLRFMANRAPLSRQVGFPLPRQDVTFPRGLLKGKSFPSFQNGEGRRFNPIPPQISSRYFPTFTL
jgi:hypothetical protein